MADWLDGELSAVLKSRVDEHLAVCDSCRAAFDQMKGMGGDLALLGRAADRMAEGAMQRARPSPVWRQAWVRAAAVVILLAGGIYLASVRRGGPGRENFVDRTPLDRGGNGNEVALVPEGECRVEGHTAVAMASANPRVRIVWLYEDAGIGEGSTPSGGGAKPQPRG